jgi:phosphoenolpyruvate synthase/pyruvate phosphate dikinase
MAEDFKECFAMECKAMKKVSDEMGFFNVEIMIPFVRTLEARPKIKKSKRLGRKGGA